MPARRATFAAAVVALAIAMASIAPGFGGEGDRAPATAERARAARLSPGELAGERVVAGFGGESPGPVLERLIRNGGVAGVILFADNYDTVGEARALIRRLQAIPHRRGPRAPLLVMLDQEGGLVKRLPGPPRHSAEEMGRLGADVARREGAATGRLLRDVGVNVDLAPVLDVARPGSTIGAQDRSFGRTRRRVARTAGAFAAAMQRRGVAATAKHFPGLGAARSDTDLATERIGLSRRRLRFTDEFPYRRFRRDHGRMVMLGTAVYPAFDDRPAALSRELASRELRRRLGYRGVSITDALDTVSARAVGGPVTLARMGARAGTDLLLYTAAGDAAKAFAALRRGLRSDRFAAPRFAASAGRVAALRRRLR